MKWEGVYTNSEDATAQADMIGDYRNFSKEVVRILVDRLQDGAKYCIGRDGGPTMKITLRDPDFSISISGLKELVKATSVEKTSEAGEVILRW
jgi:hypothetical protein